MDRARWRRQPCRPSAALIRSHSIYGLAKAGLIHLVEALAIELAPETTVNAVSPGLIADNEDMTAEFSDDAIADTPLRQLVTRDEVAIVVAAICGPTFDSVTGQNIVMDGGRVLPTQ